ncbi:tetratricopeptide repeat protein [Ramlibacter algicola]|uniref:Tetratricopeptide repeat protein n=1 Tax=Ramlibacter algicola TaxID=2795217 RepID=A0A934Q0T0_9BURK|nr:tetratricopeptide repeat protein [Ramlibacter algicola]MBK0392731.1 tetratricopeptide repeat protein [Ramlibacter algicola]
MPARGQALLQSGRWQDAAAAFRQALAQDPASLPARMGLAHAFAQGGDLPLATAWLSDACRIAPQRAEPLAALAEVLLRQQQFAQALPLYRRLHEEFAARDRATLLHLGYCHEQLGDVDAAIASYRAAIAREPSFFEAHVDLAGVLWRVEDFEGTLAHAQEAVRLAPQHPYALRILGMALLQLNRLDEAEVQLRRALAIQPDFALAQVDLAFTLLLAGKLQEGWSWYAKRWNDARMQRPAFHQAHREWSGPSQPLRGKRLLVYAEQGLGDVLQFARYIPGLQALGAQVSAVVPPELVPLLEASFEVPCVTRERSVEIDLHVALLDLPGRAGTTLESVPAAVPYLRAPLARRTAWREKLGERDGRLRVGIAWSGSPVQVNNRNRAMPLSVLQPLLTVPGVQWYSLQKGDASALNDVPLPDHVVDLTGQWRDFADSAAMLEQLDLVVTVDTSIAHLAGALGTPVWVMLPPNPDFRWLLEREDSPWYPTMRLFRRAHGEPRAAQVARVGDALRQRLPA